MTTLSPQQIEKCLRAYSADVETWAPDMGETGMTAGIRGSLHDALPQLTTAQRQALAHADAQALAHYARHKGHDDPYLDIRSLGEIVAIIESERAHAAA